MHIEFFPVSISAITFDRLVFQTMCMNVRVFLWCMLYMVYLAERSKQMAMADNNNSCVEERERIKYKEYRISDVSQNNVLSSVKEIIC